MAVSKPPDSYQSIVIDSDDDGYLDNEVLITRCVLAPPMHVDSDDDDDNDDVVFVEKIDSSMKSTCSANTSNSTPTTPPDLNIKAENSLTSLSSSWLDSNDDINSLNYSPIKHIVQADRNDSDCKSWTATASPLLKQDNVLSANEKNHESMGECVKPASCPDQQSSPNKLNMTSLLNFEVVGQEKAKDMPSSTVECDKETDLLKGEMSPLPTPQKANSTDFYADDELPDPAAIDLSSHKRQIFPADNLPDLVSSSSDNTCDIAGSTVSLDSTLPDLTSPSKVEKKLQETNEDKFSSAKTQASEDEHSGVTDFANDPMPLPELHVNKRRAKSSDIDSSSSSLGKSSTSTLEDDLSLSDDESESSQSAVKAPSKSASNQITLSDTDSDDDIVVLASRIKPRKQVTVHICDCTDTNCNGSCGDGAASAAPTITTNPNTSSGTSSNHQLPDLFPCIKHISNKKNVVPGASSLDKSGISLSASHLSDQIMYNITVSSSSHDGSLPAAASALKTGTTNLKTSSTDNSQSELTKPSTSSDSTSLARSVSTRPSVDSSCVPLKKRRVCLDAGGSREGCYSCGDLVTENSSSSCMEKHHCCGLCLQSQVKDLLGHSKKGSLKCGLPGCDSYYPLNQLRLSLPPIVVEILEEKLDREYMDILDDVLLSDVSGGLKEEGHDSMISGLDQDKPGPSNKPSDLPPHWETMDKHEDYRLVDLDPMHPEYNEIHVLFHQTMLPPRAKICRIQRVQNSILWQFFTVKKRQMQKEHITEILEKKLFHGTRQNVVDPICRSNFDWRLCGLNGTVFGQGSYFARDATYSHRFTDRGCSRSLRNQQRSGMLNALIHKPLLTAATSMIMTSQGHRSWNPWMSISNPPPAHTNLTGMMVMPGAPDTLDMTAPQQHYMFVARVLVGLYTQGTPTLRKPPTIDASTPYGRCYDSCVNDVMDPSIFVIFDSAQCYPEYLVTYTNSNSVNYR